MSDEPRPAWQRLAGLAMATSALLAFPQVGERFYQGFRIPQGFGMTHLLPDELAYTLLFVLFGSVAALGGAVALKGLPALATLSDRFRSLPLRPAAVGVAVLLALGCFALARGVLDHRPVSDDEHVYRFIAQTLLTGHLTAPSPGGDLDFFREQFVVLTEHVRFGKYPLGHPLLLAAGQRFGLEAWIVPILTGLLALPLAWIGLRLFGATTALLSLFLLLASPHLLATGATLLSQPAAALCLLLGIAGLLKADDGGRAWLALAGLAFGYGMLVRPLPIVLFAAAAAVWILATRRRDVRAALASAVLFLVPVVLAGGALLAVNRAQTGAFLVSGYQAFHLPEVATPRVTVGLGGSAAELAMSLVSSLVRLDVWLLGWPLSLLPLLFVRRASAAVALPWSMIAMAVVYRLVSPKAGVGVTGPIYLMEVAPLLCLLVAHGLVTLARRPAAAGWVMPAVVMGAVVNLTLFLPYKVADLGRSAAAQRLLPQALWRQTGGAPSLVFHDGIVPFSLGLSWAYGPPCNRPDLGGEVVYVRFDPSSLERNVDFWKRRYPQRAAWLFRFVENRPELVPLDESGQPPPRPRADTP